VEAYDEHNEHDLDAAVCEHNEVEAGDSMHKEDRTFDHTRIVYLKRLRCRMIVIRPCTYHFWFLDHLLSRKIVQYQSRLELRPKIGPEMRFWRLSIKTDRLYDCH